MTDTGQWSKPTVKAGDSTAGDKLNITRDGLKTYLDLSDHVRDALRLLLYKDAIRAMQSLQEMTDIVSDGLPGGYCGECPQCEEIKGEDELVDCGDERICQSCVDRWDDPDPASPPAQRDDSQTPPKPEGTVERESLTQWFDALDGHLCSPGIRDLCRELDRRQLDKGGV